VERFTEQENAAKLDYNNDLNFSMAGRVDDERQTYPTYP
jgi:hypothetical protein